MNLELLKLLIKQNESEQLEFKKSTGQIQAAFETICGFLNNKGGIILFGVKDDGKIIGQHVADKTRQDIAAEIAKLEPSAQLQINVKYVSIDDDKNVIVIEVKGNGYVPYTYDGRPYQRNQSTTSRMSQHHYEQLIVKRGQLNHSWEECAANGYTIDALDHDEIYNTVLEGVSGKRIPVSVAKETAEKILRQLNLLTEDGQPKRASVVLFAKEIKSPYTNCWLKMARFKGKDKGGDFVDNQQKYCNVFQMLEEADNFLRKHLPMASHFPQDQFKRIDKLALPVIAVREALVNAVCHRDYSDSAGYISIAVFDDVVEIWNNGTLPGKLKVADLKRKHDSILRNKLIAEIFYLRGYIESWGTGIKKMIDSCKEFDIPVPRFSERTGGFLVTFKFAEPISENKEIKQQKLTLRQHEILKLLKLSPLNGAQVSAKLKDAPTIRTVQVDLKNLEKIGLIIREGESRAMIWKLNS